MTGDAFMDIFQKSMVDALARSAITGCIAGWNRQLMAGIPALDHAESVLTGSIGMENLAEPCPECGEVAEAALASRAIDGLHEIGRQDGIKKHGVSAEYKKGQTLCRKSSCHQSDLF